uniref:Pyrroline-5-carboxylate reductase n=1 Tax=Ammonifex degensii TaxID=42838 RepID=A0A7C2E359_9THEO
MPLTGLKVGLIGGGAMGGALAAGLVKGGRIPQDALLVSDVNVQRLQHLEENLGVRTLQDNKLLVERVDIVILAVKPDVVVPVLQEVGSFLRPEQTVISIAAGVPLRLVEKNVPQGVPVIRVMPNTPCLVGAGASAYALGSSAGPRDAVRVEAIFASVGRVVPVKEALLDAVTGLSGSGPAYVYLVVEALADGGVRMGLPREVALVLAAQTVLGAAKMVLETGEHPAQLKDRVTTPGGTTAAGLFVLEDRGLRAALIEAVKAAAARSRELSSAGTS